MKNSQIVGAGLPATPRAQSGMSPASRLLRVATAVLICGLCDSVSAQVDWRGMINKAEKMLPQVQETVTTKTEDEELIIGQQWAAMLTGAAPLTPDVNLQRYVNRVGRWVALQSERPQLDWRFGVLESENVNAFATPGGYVFVTRGLLRLLGSEADLAGVLGHEIAHVVQKHHLAAIRKQTGLGLGANLLKEYGLSKTGYATESEKLLSGAKEVMLRGLDKGDEYEADRMGVVLAARAGYDPYGLPSVMQTLAAISAQDSSVALLFQTHPAPDARLDALERAMAANLDAYAGQSHMAERWQAQIGGR